MSDPGTHWKLVEECLESKLKTRLQAGAEPSPLKIWRKNFFRFYLIKNHLFWCVNNIIQRVLHRHRCVCVCVQCAAAAFPLLL